MEERREPSVSLYRGYEIEITEVNVNVKLGGAIIDNSFAHSRREAEYLIDRLIERHHIPPAA